MNEHLAAAVDAYVESHAKLHDAAHRIHRERLAKVAPHGITVPNALESRTPDTTDRKA